MTLGSLTVSLNKLLFIITITALSTVSISVNAETLLADSFESGDMSSTNSDGFRWIESWSTSVVNSTHETYSNGSTVYLPKSNATDFAGGDWTAKNDSYSLRFRYVAGQEPWSEQRFDIGTPKPELWIRYWLRVPTNYTNTSGNNKLFAIWMDGYSQGGYGSTVAWEYWGDGNGGSELAYHYSIEGYDVMGGHKQHTPFLSTSDRGRWMQIMIHVKAASSTSSNDGIIEMWRRWESDSAYTKFHEEFNADMGTPTGTPGWKGGYIMGYANAAFENNTEWLVDDFTISDTPFPGVEIAVAPNAPSLIYVQ